MKHIVPFDENLSYDVAAATTHEIFRLPVPANSKLFVTHFGNYIKEFDAWGHITWIFKKNGSPIYPYNAIKDQLGWGAMLRELSAVEVAGGDLFTIDIKNEYEDIVKCGVAIKYELHEV